MEHLNALEAVFHKLTPEEQKMYWCKIHKLHGYFKGIVKGVPNANKSWDWDDADMAAKMYTAGRSFVEIAKELGRTPWAIECRLKKAGVLNDK